MAPGSYGRRLRFRRAALIRGSPDGKAMARKQYIVTFDPSADADSIAAELRSNGLEVETVMREIGIISGAAEDASVSGLRGTRNVLDISESGHVGVPPPESDIQ